MKKILLSLAAALSFIGAGSSNALAQIVVPIYGGWPSGSMTQITTSSDFEAGVHFTVDSPVYVTAIKFYKVSGDYGAHTVSLWLDRDGTQANGQLLAQTARNDETSTSGWQTFFLNGPVLIFPGQHFIASVHYLNAKPANIVNNAYTSGQHYDNGPLHISADNTTFQQPIYRVTTTIQMPDAANNPQHGTFGWLVTPIVMPGPYGVYE